MVICKRYHMTVEIPFTPGPWVSDCFMVKATSGGGIYGGTIICQTGIHDVRNSQEAEANARLIAAAPEMLEIVKRVADLLAHAAASTLGQDAAALLDRLQGISQ